MEEVVKALLDANVQLTREAIGLARAVLESRGVHGSTISATTVPTFEQFVEQPQTEQERLFFTEEEEDAQYSRDLNGTTTDVEMTKAILAAAGEAELAASLKPDPA